MTSIIQIRHLEQWYDSITENTNSQHSVIIFLGSNHNQIQR
jgi:hypothetical protein